MYLSAGAKALNQPNSKLSESSIAPYSTINYELFPLHGGMPPKNGGKKGKKGKKEGKNKEKNNQNKEIQPGEKNEFNSLDEKIKSGEATDDEAKRFEKLAHDYAVNQVKKFNLSPE